MFRTAVNVWGDLLTAKVINTFYVRYLQEKNLAQKVAEKIQGKPKEV